MRADKLKDHTSLDRALSQRLVLIVREKGSSVWSFPRAVRREGERMVDAARRGVSACYGPQLCAFSCRFMHSCFICVHLCLALQW